MPHCPKPFFRTARNAWFVQIGPKQVNLGPDQDAAFRQYHELMAKPPDTPAPLWAEFVVVVIDAFLTWCEANRAGRSYDWYKERCQSFVSSIP